MHNLAQILNDASFSAAGWISELSWRTWFFLVVILIVVQHHIIRGVVALIILAGITGALIHA